VEEEDDDEEDEDKAKDGANDAPGANVDEVDEEAEDDKDVGVELGVGFEDELFEYEEKGGPVRPPGLGTS